MMEWKKMGLIYEPEGLKNWKFSSALTPTPIVLEKVIRVYAGLRDEEGVSRIGYIDLDKNDPSKIIRVSDTPVLDIGIGGTFDDNGLILGDIVWVNGDLYMYYVGFQLVKKAKFLAFTGLAISKDKGNTFTKYSQSPILDRRYNSLFFNAVHTLIYEDNKFKFWLGAGSNWETINNVPYPSYNVKYIESVDGINFPDSSIDVLEYSRQNEYRIGRPRVYKNAQGQYQMIFTWGDLLGNYRMGYADSEDGITWIRNDNKINFHPSENGWDDKSVSYGALFNVNDTTYMVYNGNEMGKDGFGLAILKK